MTGGGGWKKKSPDSGSGLVLFVWTKLQTSISWVLMGIWVEDS